MRGLTAAVVLGLTVVFIACDRASTTDVPPPSGETSPGSPTPLAAAPGNRNPEDPFWVFSQDLDASLRVGDVQMLIERLRTRTITCTEADVPPHIGGPECFVVGDTFEGFSIGRWRSEGGVVPVTQVVEQLRYLSTAVRRDLSDPYGTGTIQVFALNSQPQRHVAIITAIINSPPGFGGASTIRVSFGTYWTLDGDVWRLTGLMTNYIYSGEFLEPTPEARAGLFPAWERFAP